MMHAWERRQAEREARAAAETVGRLERALAVNAEELDCRLEQLAGVRAAVEANRARMEAANQAGVRVVFDGSRREAEPLFERVPMAAVVMMEQAIKDSDRLTEEESRLLGRVTNCERERDRLGLTLAHWTRVRDGLADGLAMPDATTDGPTGSAPAVGTFEPEVEPAEAAAVQGSVPGLIVVPPPASGSIRNRLDAIGRRIGQW